MQQLMSFMRAALERYNMIDDGDKIAVGVSGGKDSMILLCALAEIRRFYPKKFEVYAISIDPQFGGNPADYSQISEICRRLNIEYSIKRTRLWEIIFQIRKETNPCSLCAKMRRGAIHDAAKELGCNKVALGHHMDDAVETFFMNLLNGGTIASFQPVSYLSRKDLYLIRPLIFCEEKEIIRVINKTEIPIVKSLCPADGCTEREKAKGYINDLEKEYPALKKKIIGAMQKKHISDWS
ncbi:MAG: tRNA 2-thiocytidine biosynthesis TtcA family protein [Oscillospiraceae bacterium]